MCGMQLILANSCMLHNPGTLIMIDIFLKSSQVKSIKVRLSRAHKEMKLYLVSCMPVEVHVH
jgi:hypothetical protein